MGPEARPAQGSKRSGTNSLPWVSGLNAIAGMRLTQATKPRCLSVCSRGGYGTSRRSWSIQAFRQTGLQGWSVSISADGNTAIVGGPWADVLRDYPNPRPFLPRRRLGWTGSGGVWSRQAKLSAQIPSPSALTVFQAGQPQALVHSRAGRQNGTGDFASRCEAGRGMALSLRRE
jgi:hypothetical protein